MDIRSANNADMVSCHRCLAIVAEEGRWLSRLNAPPVESYAVWWTSMRKRQAPQVVATDNGAIVGWCDIAPRDGPLHAHIGSLGMGLLPAYRQRGLGTQLITLALKQARERGLERIELSVLHDNEAALALYTGVGFVVEGRRHREWNWGRFIATVF